MSTFGISESRAPRALAASWQLAQMFWVGGLWLMHFVMLPAIAGLGLAPLLVEEIRASLTPLLLLIAAVAVLLQAVLLVWAEGWKSLWRDLRGQLLLAAWLLVMVFFIVRGLDAAFSRWLVFNYLMVAVCGLVLVLQPLPGRSAVEAKR